MAYTYDDLLISDLHKDVYGYRPRDYLVIWRAMSPAMKQKEWDRLCAELEENEKREQARALLSYEQWDNHIKSLMTDNNIARGTAIRWDMAAMDCGDDVGFYCFKWGLAFSTEDEILDVMKERV